MSTIAVGIAVMIIISGAAIIITQCIYWYERKIASWHHEMMLEEFRSGWDAAIEYMRGEK